MTKNISLFQNKFSGENLFFTSDTHFFHEGIIKFCTRPFESVEEMNETLIRNWNETVPKDGTVFHLGDFAFGGWQLFGHVHSGPRSKTGKDIPRLSMLFPTQYDVGVDNNGFRPLSFEELKTIIQNQQRI